MKKLLFLFILITTILQSALAQCSAGSDTIKTNTLITGSCVINGNLTILNGATLNVDLSGSPTDTFVLRGNILLQGNAILWVHGDSASTGSQFIVSNTYSNQRSITTLDSSKIQLEYIEFRTQEGNLSNAGSFYMNYYAEGNSILYVNKCLLNPQTAWLLCNLKNKSTLIGYNSNKVPTETYLQDTAQLSLHGAATNMGVWLSFESETGTLNLPSNQTVPYSWKIGRGNGGLSTLWYLEIDTANPGLGVQIFPTSKITINGAGSPDTGELKVALMFSNNNDTVKNLKVGLQNTTITNGPTGSITLNNVNLGPIAWQVYALIDEHLFIKNSTVNEIGIAGPSQITVDSSLLQLALLAAVGQGGSSMTINNCDIWNQAITAANNSTMILNNCSVTGSWFNTADTLSHITVNGGCFFQNPSGCTEDNMINIITGQPYCNAFIPAGFPQNLTPSTVTFNGVNNNCTNGIEPLSSNNEQVNIFPNPTNGDISIMSEKNIVNFKVINALGQLIYNTTPKQTQFNFTLKDEGIYFITVTSDNETTVRKVIVIK